MGRVPPASLLASKGDFDLPGSDPEAAARETTLVVQIQQLQLFIKGLEGWIRELTRENLEFRRLDR